MEWTEARRKPAVVTALAAPSFKGTEPVTDFGDDFYEAEVIDGMEYYDEPQVSDGLAAAMAMQPEGGSRAVSRESDHPADDDSSLQHQRESKEEREERRRRRKEKKERHERRKKKEREGVEAGSSAAAAAAEV